MKNMSRSVLTIIVIFGAAFLLAAAGCAASSNSGNPPALTAPVQTNGNTNTAEPDTAALQPHNPNELRECTDQEFAELSTWTDAVQQAKDLIMGMGPNSSRWIRNQGAVNSCLGAISRCDNEFNYHLSEPCKRTRVTVVGTTVVVYDAFAIRAACSNIDSYLRKFDLRPDSNSGDHHNPGQPPPYQPIQPAPYQPQPAPNPGYNPGQFAACTMDEFTSLNQWSSQVDAANTNIQKLGATANWKYDANAISSASSATNSCESLMQYHASKPCEKDVKQNDGSMLTKQYTHDSIAQRCQMARSYYYEFAQRTSTLNSNGADLYIDLSHFNQQRFDPGAFVTFGNCVVQNKTAATIDYTGQKALVKDSRGFESKMMVLETNERLLIQCYGLDLNGAFSTNQIQQLLQSKGSDIRLQYQLK